MYYFIFFIVFIIVGLAILEFIFWSFEKAFNYLEEYFFPTPEFTDEILDAIEREAHDFVWNMHRVGDEPEMGEYYRVLNFLYHKKYTEHFSQ